MASSFNDLCCPKVINVQSEYRKKDDSFESLGSITSENDEISHNVPKLNAPISANIL